MPKHGFFSPKAIGNRIKSKGLQKLRWYCEMCNKQCRDENGFKCHCMSEAHMQQMLLVAENPDIYVDRYSDDFVRAFLAQLKRTKGTTRVAASHFYNEYIADKEHVHMNATRWERLTDVIMYMGKEGHCVVDETPKGWYIQYIDKDPEVLKRQAQLNKLNKASRDEEDRQAQVIADIVEKNKARVEAAGGQAEAVFTDLKRDNPDEKVAIAFDADKQKQADKAGGQLKSMASMFKQNLKKSAAGAGPASGEGGARKGEKRKLSNLELIRQREEERKAKQARLSAEAEAKAQASSESRKDYWLLEGIVVKIMNKKLGDGKFYKKKAYVKQVIDRYGAKVSIIDGKATLTIDQDELETVLPSIGGSVLVVNGRYRGLRAKLQAINQDSFNCDVTIREGANKGKNVSGLEYEDICKLHI